VQYADGSTDHSKRGARSPEPGARSPEPGLASSLAMLAGPWILAFVFAAVGFAKALKPEPIGDR